LIELRWRRYKTPVSTELTHIREANIRPVLPWYPGTYIPPPIRVLVSTNMVEQTRTWEWAPQISAMVHLGINCGRSYISLIMLKRLPHSFRPRDIH